MTTRWDVPHTRRCKVCKSWPPEPGSDKCVECLDAELTRKLEESIEAAKARASHAERGKR